MGTLNGERHEERFEVGQNSELSVSNVSGRTRVSAVDSSEIIVRYSKSGSKGGEPAQVEVSRSGNRVTVQTRSKTTGLFNFSRSSAVDYDISVPRDCSVTLQSVSAYVRLEGTRGDTGIRTVSGDVEIKDVSGDISITTVSGDIQGGKLSGTLISRTTSGDGEFRRSNLRRFSVNTVSGDFTIETALVREELCTAKTVSGDLQLLIPPTSGATVQLKSISGSVSCSLPAEIIKAGRRHWQGRVNGGGGQVDMNSVSGDLSVGASAATETMVASEPDSSNWTGGRATDTPAFSPEESDSGTTDEPSADVKEILAALERGEISVEEAMGQIG